MKTFNNTKNSAFSLAEAIVAVGIIGLLCLIAVPIASKVHSGARLAKLQQDVKHLNSAVDIYRANGGSFDGLTEPQAILDKMKTERSDTNRAQFVGMTGSTIDKRLVARKFEKKSSKAEVVAVWNAAKYRFDIVESSQDGVLEFYLNDAIQEKEFKAEDREMSEFAYNDKPGWIWKFTEPAPVDPAGPATVPLGDPTNTTPPAPVVAVKLIAPMINPPGGVFDESAFPKTITIVNPNAADTWVVYTVSGGPPLIYNGAFTLTDPGTVVAFATGDPVYWINSSKVSKTYDKKPPPPPVELLPPLFQLSSSSFNDATPEITVTINNPNPSGSSNLFYAIVPSGDSQPDIADWTAYSGPFLTTAATYPEGFDVVAYAKSTDPEAYTDSAPASAETSAEFFGIPIVGDVLFIVDASSSMSGNNFGNVTRFEAMILELTQAIQGLPGTLKFNVAMFDEGNHWTDGTYKLHNATAPAKQTLIEELEDVDSGSGTNYAAAFAFPAMFNPVPDQVIFLTDGEPDGSYATELAALVALGIRLDAIGIDVGQDEIDLLDAIAGATGGKAYAADPPAN